MFEMGKHSTVKAPGVYPIAGGVWLSDLEYISGPHNHNSVMGGIAIYMYKITTLHYIKLTIHYKLFNTYLKDAMIISCKAFHYIYMYLIVLYHLFDSLSPSCHPHSEILDYHML